MNVFDKLAASSEDHVGVSREGPTDVRPTKIMGKNDYDEKGGIAKNVEGRRIAFGSFQGQQPVVIFNDTGKSVLITKNQVINVGFLARTRHTDYTLGTRATHSAHRLRTRHSSYAPGTPTTHSAHRLRTAKSKLHSTH